MMYCNRDKASLELSIKRYYAIYVWWVIGLDFRNESLEITVNSVTFSIISSDRFVSQLSKSFR